MKIPKLRLLLICMLSVKNGCLYAMEPSTSKSKSPSEKSRRQEMKMPAKAAIDKAFETASSKSDSFMGDRLVLEIGRHTFTQRYLELYIGVKFLLTKRLSYPYSGGFITSHTWQSALEMAKQDMLISIEAKRLGRFYPVPSTIMRLAQDIDYFLRSDQNFANLVLRLGANRRKLLKIAAEVIQIDEFLRNKSRSDSNQQNSWLENIEKQYIVRYFQGYENYIPIQPMQDRATEAL